MNEITLIPTQLDAGKRIDSYLAEQMEGMTRSAAQNLLANGAVTAAGKPMKKNDKLTEGMPVTVVVPALREVNLTAENIPIDIIYEDEDIIVVNKPRGMVVHPAAGNWNGTLVNALMYHCGERLSGINGEHRPGIVHRIDKDTSGLLVIAKNGGAHQCLAAQIAAHTARRGYQAIVVGAPRLERGVIDKPIARHRIDRKKMAIADNGRHAVTHYSVLQRYPGYTHMAFQLETGRTHQIRVHMASIGHPIIGDPLYGLKKDRFSAIGGQCLHAAELTLVHPKTKESLSFAAPLPDYFTDVLNKLARMR